MVEDGAYDVLLGRIDGRICLVELWFGGCEVMGGFGCMWCMV